MPPRRERPLHRLDISLESLPPPEPKRTYRLNLSFSGAEIAMIEKAARERGEQPGVFCRTIILTVFQNSAASFGEGPGLRRPLKAR